MEQFFALTLDAVARRTRRLNAIGGQKIQLSSELVEINLLTVKHTMAQHINAGAEANYIGQNEAVNIRVYQNVKKLSESLCLLIYIGPIYMQPISAKKMILGPILLAWPPVFSFWPFSVH